jgi:hypothetical protein
MRGEFDLFGIYLPPLMLAGLLAWPVTWLLFRALNRFGFYRFVWHRPMVNLALFVLVLGGIVFGLGAIMPNARGILPT